jgi:hypothetical protein
MSDFITKARQADEGGVYITIMELPRRGRICKIVIRAVRECSSPYLYPVLENSRHRRWTIRVLKMAEL